MDQILSVGIATKNRALELVKCVQSLELLGDLNYEIIIVDDGSEKTIEPILREKVDEKIFKKVMFIRWEKSRNLMAARNEIVKCASGNMVLLLDDDAYLLDEKELLLSLNVMEKDDQIGSLAFPECNADGGVKKKQPGKGVVPCYTTNFYGYAHAVRRDAFLAVGGYREIFWFYHEESDLCKKMLNRRLKCLYWPAAKIAHIPSQIDRGQRDLRRFQYGLRNRSLDAMYNEPLLLCLLSVAGCCLKYAFGELRYRLEYGLEETGGRWWLVKELRALRTVAWKDRAPLKWSVFLQWRLVRRSSPEYLLDEGRKI